MLYWQNVLVILILLLAIFYLARRSWGRLRPLLKEEPVDRVACGSTKCCGCDSSLLRKNRE